MNYDIKYRDITIFQYFLSKTLKASEFKAFLKERIKGDDYDKFRKN